MFLIFINRQYIFARNVCQWMSSALQLYLVRNAYSEYDVKPLPGFAAVSWIVSIYQRFTFGATAKTVHDFRTILGC